MEFLVAAIVGFFVWRWYKKLKRVQFIQATEYLSQLEGGASVDEANGAALKLFRGGSVDLNSVRAVSKWISASVMPPPLRVSAG